MHINMGKALRHVLQMGIEAAVSTAVFPSGRLNDEPGSTVIAVSTGAQPKGASVRPQAAMIAPSVERLNRPD